MAGTTLVLFLSANLYGANGVALLTGPGSAKVDGIEVGATTTIGNGDEIATGPDGLRTFSIEETSYIVGPSSEFVYHPAEVTLDSGNTTITTFKGVATKVKNYQVKPADASATTKYEVTYAKGGRVFVFARSGKVSISGCGKSLELLPDQIAYITSPATCHGGVWPYDGPWSDIPGYGAAAAAVSASVLAATISSAGPKMSAEAPEPPQQ